MSKIMSMLDLFIYPHLLMHISAMRMSWLIIFYFCAVLLLSKNSSSAIVSAISKRVPVRLLISCSTILHTGLIVVYAKKKCSMWSVG